MALIHPLTHTEGAGPGYQDQFEVKSLAQGDFGMWIGGDGNLTIHPAINRWVVLPPEPKPKM